jgi:hypothetical protein
VLLINLIKNAHLNSTEKNTCDNENPVISRMRGMSFAIVAHSGLIPLDADKLEVHYKGP